MDSVTALGLGRIAIGTVALSSPTLAARLFRLDGPGNPQLAYMTRMFGSREIAIGAAGVLVRGRSREAVVAGGIAVDAADAVAGVLAVRDGSVGAGAGAGLTAPAVLAVLTGITALRRR